MGSIPTRSTRNAVTIGNDDRWPERLPTIVPDNSSDVSEPDQLCDMFIS